LEKLMAEKTPVVFRAFRGEIVALFPTIPAVCGKPWLVESYAHIGQHSAADYSGVVQGSRPAKPSEYKALAQELRQVGYDLKVVQRQSPALRAKLNRNYRRVCSR
jgi:hypothetical protein